MALLAEGSNVDEGKYSKNLRDAMNWFLNQKSKDKEYENVLANPDLPGSTGRYMPEHGVALSFLARLHGDVDNARDREKLRKRITEGISFAVGAQTSFGGWFYTKSMPGHENAENVATMVVLQGLLDAREAGLAVPRETIRKASRYLESCTTKEGGIIYSGDGKPTNLEKGGRPVITAMAVAAWLPMLERYDGVTRRWLGFCADNPSLSPNVPEQQFQRKSVDMLAHYYMCRIVFHLDEHEWKAAFPDKKLPDQLNRAKYRTTLFERLKKDQEQDGSWSQAWTPGVVFNTALALNILQYENTIPLRLSR